MRVMAYRSVLVSDYCVVVSIECFVGLIVMVMYALRALLKD